MEGSAVVIDPETLTDEQLYVEIHTWEHQQEHSQNYYSAALRPLYREAADRWMKAQEAKR